MANFPEYNAGVMADSFQVRKPVESNEPEILFQKAQLAQQVAGTFGNVAVQEATKASEQAGANAMIYEQMPDGTTRLRRLEDLQALDIGAGNQAYNRALLQQYSAAVQTDARTALGGFQARHANSPGEFNAAAQGYIRTLVDSMPKNARGTINGQLQVMASQFGGAIAERQQRVAQEQIFQTSLRAGMDMVGDGDNRSANNPNDPMLPQIRANLVQHLQGMRTTHGDHINDVMIAQTLRSYDLTIEGNRVSMEANRIYERGGSNPASREAALRYIDQWRRQPSAGAAGPLLRTQLHPGEDAYFRAHPEVAGMAASDNRVIVNPYSPSTVNRDAVIQNETARIVMRTGGRNLQPTFDLTEEQRATLRGTPYERASPTDQRATIAARILSGDPSGGSPTPDQTAFVTRLRAAMPGGGGAAAAGPPGTPGAIGWSTQERDTIAQRATMTIGDRENRRLRLEAERRQHDADVQRQATVEQQRLLQGAGDPTRAIPPGDVLAQRNTVETVMQRFGPQLSQSAREELRVNLTNPNIVEMHRQQQEFERGHDAVNLAMMLDQNRQAATNGQPFPYPLTQVTQQFPQHQWGTAASAIIEQQNAVAAAQATLAAQSTRVQRAMDNPNASVPAASADFNAVYNVSARDQQTGRRRAPNLDDTRAGGEAEVAYTQARLARAIAQPMTDRMSAGAANGATLQAALNADETWRGLRADPRTREEMTRQIGTIGERLQRQSEELANILKPDNQRTHNPDGSLNQVQAEVQWQQFQHAMTIGANMTSAEVTANIGRSIGNTTNPQQGMLSLMQETIGIMQPGGMTPDMRSATGTVGLTGVAESVGLGTVNPTLPTGLPSNSPFLAEDVAFLGSFGNPNFGYSLLGTTRSMPVEMGSTEYGAGKVFMQGVEEAARRGITNRAELGQAGYRRMRLEGYGPTYLGNGRTDTATIVRYPFEEEARRQGHDPVQTVSLLVGAAVSVENAYVANGQESPFRYPGDHLRGVTNKDIWVQMQEGTDGSPAYILMARGPRGPGGTPGEVRPITWVPGMESIQGLARRPGMGMNAQDLVVLTIPPNPQGQADIARRQELRTAAADYVTRTHPNLSTLARRAMIGFTEIEMEWGLRHDLTGGIGTQAVQPGRPVPAQTGTGSAAAARGRELTDEELAAGGQPPPAQAGPRIPPSTGSVRRRQSQMIEPPDAPRELPPEPPPEPSDVEDPITGFRSRRSQGPPRRP